MLSLGHMPNMLLRYKRKFTNSQGLCPFFEAVNSPVPGPVAKQIIYCVNEFC